MDEIGLISSIQNTLKETNFLLERISVDTSFIQDYQILISSFLALCGTLYIVYSSRKFSQRNASLEVTNSISQDDMIQEGFSVMRSYHNDPNKNIEILAHKYSKEINIEKEKFLSDQSSVMYVLNQYEYLSIGINNKSYDEKLIKESSFTTIIAVSNMCKPLVKKVHSLSKSKTIWCNFFCLSEKWDKTPLKPKKIKE